MITIIAAVAENRAIGHKGRLLFRLRADMRRFKALTTGHTVLMGRKTFESLPKGALPERRNLVLTRTEGFSAPGIETFASLDAALASCKADEKVFIIGGSSVYAEAMPLADRLCLTHVHATPPEADAFFPELAPGAWRPVESERHEADAENEAAYTFADYARS
ncbi:MAG: dihydrofolate reductase [Prevotellaceae bacterium]|nr:dihydrofolate reductase [Prevotellaceae bacterium]